MPLTIISLFVLRIAHFGEAMFTFNSTYTFTFNAINVMGKKGKRGKSSNCKKAEGKTGNSRSPSAKKAKRAMHDKMAIFLKIKVSHDILPGLSKFVINRFC